MDACTVTALDATTAFAVTNPGYSSQRGRFFQAWKLFELPLRADHPAYFGPGKLSFPPTLSAVDESEVKHSGEKSQRRFSVQSRESCCANPTDARH